jgi:hypothetical protein
MRWIALTYSLPSKPQSTQRVALWRRLRRLGAVSPTGSLYILPAQAQCVEAFQWLIQEIRQAQGEAFAAYIERFDGISDQRLVELFDLARKKEYAQIEARAVVVEQSIRGKLTAQETLPMKETVDKLQREYSEVMRIDYFRCADGLRVRDLLTRIEQALAPDVLVQVEIKSVAIADYQNKKWVTRPRPHVDRLACAWLIRRFIDPHASIRYATTPEADEVSFDMQDGEFGHQGPWCTFETMLRAFQLDGAALQKLAQIVHEIDLRDGHYVHPETTGIDALLQGWLLADMSDHQLEGHGIALFEGLYLLYQLPRGTDIG